MYYFDGLKNKIDLLVEIYILENQHEQVCIDEVNKAREEWIKEIDECEAHNLAELEENENKDELITDEKLFKRFCFLIHSYANFNATYFTGRFISTDKYLKPGQIECFQELLKFASSENIFFSEEQLFKSLMSLKHIARYVEHYFSERQDLLY
jgi:hypothetical protein